ncbi:hypothetical protein NEUTE1DRAFT_39505, partial [Neurospora tetrasperma FGSC 2508]
ISVVLYLTIIIRPNIIFTLSRLARFLINSRLIHYSIIERVKVYLCSTNYYTF